MDLIDGTDAIRYWDEGISDWADIMGATDGNDYTLEFLTNGHQNGYTVLTVGAVPEPATLLLGCVAFVAISVLRKRRYLSCDV